MSCNPLRSRTLVMLEFVSLGVLSLTVTLSLYFIADPLEGPAAVSEQAAHGARQRLCQQLPQVA
jgi:hypothetical protein